MRKIIVSTLATIIAASAAPAFAGEARWTDGQYLQANRCLALAQSAALGELPTGDLAAQIKSQEFGRGSAITDRGVSLRAEATRQGKTKDEIRKAKLLAERDGVCKVYLSAQVAAS
ncbi:hypothetical protein [Caulobacter sp.]|uniref:hypothetical protein n=1 Tax=Caulobacter sp. TaxID=78 RepID=UPI002B4797FA|nr:hypothetical protein [Caulobacter sp.]HJV42938.1 hypothetical protein [Caulobacter sp.]